MQQIQKTANVP